MAVRRKKLRTHKKFTANANSKIQKHHKRMQKYATN